MNNSYEELIAQAKSAYEKGDLEESIKYYEEAFKEKIVLADLLMLGFIYIDADHLQKALEVFDKIKLYQDSFEVRFGYANIYERLGKTSKALELYEEVIKLEPTFEIAYFNLAYLYDDIASENEEDFNGPNYQKAIKNYEDCIKINPDNFWAHINIGSIYEKFDFDTKALDHFTKAYNIDKNEKMVAYNLGVVYSKLKNYDEAKKYYELELKREEPYISTYYNLAIVYKDGYKDYEKAKYYYLLGLSKNKEDYNIWYNLGCIYSLLNDYANAFDCFKYIYYKNKKYLNLLKTDNELDGFRKTEFYNKLINGL